MIGRLVTSCDSGSWCRCCWPRPAPAVAMGRAPQCHPRHSDPQVVVCEVARSPQLLEQHHRALIRALTDRLTSRRSAARRMGYSFIYVILAGGASRPRVRSSSPIGSTPSGRSCRPTRRDARPQRQQHGLDLSVRDRRSRGRDLRELRLMNEGQIKLPLQAVPAWPKWRRWANSKAIPGEALSADARAHRVSLQRVGTLRGVRRWAAAPSVTNRSSFAAHPAATTADLEHLVIGRDPAGAPVQLKDIGYLQVGYDLRRSTADLDGNGELVATSW